MADKRDFEVSQIIIRGPGDMRQGTKFVIGEIRLEQSWDYLKYHVYDTQGNFQFATKCSSAMDCEIILVTPVTRAIYLSEE